MTLDTATVTRAEARHTLDELAQAIRVHANAQYERGKAIEWMDGERDDDYRAAVVEDEASRLRMWDEFETVTALLLGLIEQRTVSATALRLVQGGAS